MGCDDASGQFWEGAEVLEYLRTFILIFLNFFNEEVKKVNIARDECGIWRAVSGYNEIDYNTEYEIVESCLKTVITRKIDNYPDETYNYYYANLGYQDGLTEETYVIVKALRGC